MNQIRASRFTGILSLALILALLIGMIPVLALADGEEVTTANPIAEAEAAVANEDTPPDTESADTVNTEPKDGPEVTGDGEDGTLDAPDQADTSEDSEETEGAKASTEDAEGDCGAEGNGGAEGSGGAEGCQNGEADGEEDETAEETVEETGGTGSISGTLWLDMLEDTENGIYSGNGIYEKAEQPLSGYPVSLYLEGDLNNAVQSIITGYDGLYRFEGLEPGVYVVGISSGTVGGMEYLLPMVGAKNDNKFYFTEDNAKVISDSISIGEDTAATGIDCAMRTPPEYQARDTNKTNTRTIYGKILNKDGEPVCGMYVCLYVNQTGTAGTWGQTITGLLGETLLSGAYTNSDGSFMLTSAQSLHIGASQFSTDKISETFGIALLSSEGIPSVTPRSTTYSYVEMGSFHINVGPRAANNYNSSYCYYTLASTYFETYVRAPDIYSATLGSSTNPWIIQLAAPTASTNCSLQVDYVGLIPAPSSVVENRAAYETVRVQDYAYPVTGYDFSGWTLTYTDKGGTQRTLSGTDVNGAFAMPGVNAVLTLAYTPDSNTKLVKVLHKDISGADLGGPYDYYIGQGDPFTYNAGDTSTIPAGYVADSYKLSTDPPSVEHPVGASDTMIQFTVTEDVTVTIYYRAALVDIVVPGSFLWYADKSTANGGAYDIKSGIYTIKNISQDVNLKMELTDYAEGSTPGGYNWVGTANPDIEVNLTGDLAEDGLGQNLLDYSGAAPPAYDEYGALLASINGAADGVGKSIWTFGFNGTYHSSVLPNVAELTNYTISLKFTAVSRS